MAQFYEMPAISPTMEVGSIEKWRIAEGERFESSAVIAEIGTDKATMEAEIYEDGFLLKHLVAEGDEVPPGTPIAIWGTSKDEDITDLLAQAKAPPKKVEAPEEEAPEAEAPEAAAPEPEAPKEAPEPPAPKPGKGRAPEPAKGRAPARVAAPSREWMGQKLPAGFADPPGDVHAAEPGEERVAATPLARKVAEDLGVDLRRIEGTGPGGRIVRADVEQAPKGAPAGPATRPDETLPHTPMRRTIAKRLLASHQDIPFFFLTATFDMSAFVALREQLKQRLPDLKASYNDMLMLAVARALREVPDANASWGEKAIIRHGRVDVGFAVALPTGLITPILRDADRKGLSELASETRALAQKARDGKLTPEEYTGNTFTVSNLGMMQIEQFTAIINPPASAILAVGAIEQVPVVQDGELRIGWRMKVTMTCDHRVIDGSVGATWLQALRRYVEAPALMLV